MTIPSNLIINFIQSEFSGVVRTTSGELHFNSPFETTDRKKRCYINEKDGRWTDFKAGLSGNFLSFVKEYIGLNTNYDAIKYLVDNYSFEYSEEIKDERTINEKEIIYNFLKTNRPILFKDGKNLDEFGKKAYQYVLDRKLNEEYYYTMGYIHKPGSIYDNRVFIPFFENGKLVYCLNRSIDPKNQLRYLNISDLDSKQYVFNIDKINDEVVICEGVFDAMSITSDQPATCLMSADVGNKQLEKLYNKRVKNIIYVPDNDKTGHKKMLTNIKKIIQYCPYDLNIYTFDVPNDCKDLNDMKIKHGKDYILKKECTKFGESVFNRGI